MIVANHRWWQRYTVQLTILALAFCFCIAFTTIRAVSIRAYPEQRATYTGEIMDLGRNDDTIIMRLNTGEIKSIYFCNRPAVWLHMRAQLQIHKHAGFACFNQITVTEVK